MPVQFLVYGDSEVFSVFNLLDISIVYVICKVDYVMCTFQKIRGLRLITSGDSAA